MSIGRRLFFSKFLVLLLLVCPNLWAAHQPFQLPFHAQSEGLNRIDATAVKSNKLEKFKRGVRPTKRLLLQACVLVMGGLSVSCGIGSEMKKADISATDFKVTFEQIDTAKSAQDLERIRKTELTSSSLDVEDQEGGLGSLEQHLDQTFLTAFVRLKLIEGKSIELAKSLDLIEAQLPAASTYDEFANIYDQAELLQAAANNLKNTILESNELIDEAKKSLSRSQLEAITNELSEVGVLSNDLMRPVESLKVVKFRLSDQIVWKTRWEHGVAGVYNPSTQEIEWKTEWDHGVAGVYNPNTQQVEWKTEWEHGVAGVYNPKTQQVEWKTEWDHGVAGVYNPNTQQVEWKTRWEHGVAGVYNPNTKQVEWKTRWEHGVAGVYNPVTRRVEWKTRWEHGVSGVLRPKPVLGKITEGN